jgi:hypothetical protein
MKLADLAKPFAPERVSWRVGSTTQDKKRGMALAYIDARDVMDRLDEVCGAHSWSRRHPEHAGKTVICEIGIKLGDEWVWKADGAGDTDVEAEKGSLSDSFKRAAVNWGIGRYLYDLDTPWVELEPAGRSFKIPDREKTRLQAILRGHKPLDTGELREVLGQALYMSAAKDIISVALTKQNLRDWWKAEAGARRAAGLTQADVKVLQDAMTEKAEGLPDNNTILGAA